MSHITTSSNKIHKSSDNDWWDCSDRGVNTGHLKIQYTHITQQFTVFLNITHISHLWLTIFKTFKGLEFQRILGIFRLLGACFFQLCSPLNEKKSLILPLSIPTCSLSFIFWLPPLFLSLSLRSSSPLIPTTTTSFLLVRPLSISLAFSLYISLIVHYLPFLPRSLSLPPLHPFFFFSVKKRSDWERHSVRIAGSRWRLSAPADSLCRSDLSPLH